MIYFSFCVDLMTAKPCASWTTRSLSCRQVGCVLNQCIQQFIAADTFPCILPSYLQTAEDTYPFIWLGDLQT